MPRYLPHVLENSEPVQLTCTSKLRLLADYDVEIYESSCGRAAPTEVCAAWCGTLSVLRADLKDCDIVLSPEVLPDARDAFDALAFKGWTCRDKLQPGNPASHKTLLCVHATTLDESSIKGVVADLVPGSRVLVQCPSACLDGLLRAFKYGTTVAAAQLAVRVPQLDTYWVLYDVVRETRVQRGQ